MLVLGGSGLVGSTLINYAYKNFQIHYTYNNNKIDLFNLPSSKIDLMKDFNSLDKVIEKFSPNIIIHTVGHPSVDDCEKNSTYAKQLHVVQTKKIVKVANEINAKIVFLSTDAVFNGKNKKKYVETDPACPINVYGETKVDAERIVLQNSNNVVLRPAVIYGWHKKSRFTNWIIESLREGKSVDPHNDQYNTPTLVDDLVKAIIEIVKQNVSGIFHSTGKTCVNRYELACKIAEVFSFDKKLIKPVSSMEKKQEAPRPPRTCLDSTKLEEVIDYRFKELDEGLKYLLEKSNQSFQIT